MTDAEPEVSTVGGFGDIWPIRVKFGPRPTNGGQAPAKLSQVWSIPAELYVGRYLSGVCPWHLPPALKVPRLQPDIDMGMSYTCTYT